MSVEFFKAFASVPLYGPLRAYLTLYVPLTPEILTLNTTISPIAIGVIEFLTDNLIIGLAVLTFMYKGLPPVLGLSIVLGSDVFNFLPLFSKTI